MTAIIFIKIWEALPTVKHRIVCRLAQKAYAFQFGKAFLCRDGTMSQNYLICLGTSRIGALDCRCRQPALL